MADEDVNLIIEVVRGMKQLQTLRLAPFGLFNSFIGDWRFVKGHLVDHNPEMKYENQQWKIDMDGHDSHDYCDDSEGDVDMLGSTKLRELQSLLPRNCKLTNNGSGFINESWGTAFDEHAVCCSSGPRCPASSPPLSSVSPALSQDQCSSFHRPSGTSLEAGCTRRCHAKEAADPDGRAAKRFYQCADDWHAASSVIEKLKLLGPVIET